VDALAVQLAEQVPALAKLRVQSFDCDLDAPSVGDGVGAPSDVESGEMEVSADFFPSAGLRSSIFADRVVKEEEAAPKGLDKGSSDDEGFWDVSLVAKRRAPCSASTAGFLKRGRTNFPGLLHLKEAQQAIEVATNVTFEADANVDIANSPSKAEAPKPVAKSNGSRRRRHNLNAEQVETISEASLGDAELSLRFTPEVASQKCMARVWNSGRGGQCQRAPVKDSVFLC
jgi:hypothetical protein